MINIIIPQHPLENLTEHWVEGYERVMFICGLGGSGKTTTGKDYAETWEGKHVPLDQYFKQLIRDKTGNPNPDYEAEAYKHGVKWLLEDNPEGKVVFEGAQVRWLNPNEVAYYSYLLLRESFVTSTWRACKRDFSKEHWEKWHSIVPHKHFYWNLKAFWKMKKFYKADVFRLIESGKM